MNSDLFQGELIRITVDNPQSIAEAFRRWARNSEYLRLMSGSPPLPTSVNKIKEWIEKELEADPPTYYIFLIHTLDDDRLIGEFGLEIDYWNHGDTFVGISIGDREDWGKGYGTDAMRVILRYVFTELNLHRVSLNVFEYNPRAIRSYEKAGFTVEGRVREALNRDGKRWDLIFMGVLRKEWEANQK